MSIENNKPVATNDEVNLDDLLWTPGQADAKVVTDEETKSFDFKADTKKQKVMGGEMLQAVTSVMQDLNNIPKDVLNAIAKTESEEIIKACEFAEQRGYNSFVNLGRLVLGLDAESDESKGDSMTNPFTVEMGDLWDRTDYSYLQMEKLEDVNKRFEVSLKDALQSLEGIEDDWKDARSESANEHNKKMVDEWVRTYVIELTKGAREVVELMRDRRRGFEEKIERPKYSSLGEALKAQDVPEFEKMLKKANYDKTDKDHAEILNKLFNYAIKNGISGAISPLAEVGADVKQLDNEGRTFFMLAAEKGDVALAKQLKEHGVLVNEKDLNGITELVLAVKGGHLEMVKFLVEELNLVNNEDVGVNAACWKGYTPLVYAASEEHVEVAAYLLEVGADPTHKVWFEQNASVSDYTETPELEALLADAEVKWQNKQAGSKLAI